MYRKKFLIGILLICGLNVLVYAEYIGSKVFEIDLTGYDNYSNSTENIPISENAEWALMQYSTGSWSNGDRKYYPFKLNLETGEKIMVDIQHNSFYQYGLVGISNDGNKIIYKNNTGSGYGNYYEYDFSTNVEENILLGPDNSSPNRQSYNGSTNINLDQFAVMSYATNWYNGQKGHVYYRDLISKKTVLVDKGINGEEANSDPYKIGIIGTKYVVYESPASNIVANDGNDKTDVFLYNIENKTNKKISFDINGKAFPVSASLIQYNKNSIIFAVNSKLYAYNLVTGNITSYINKSFSPIRISKDNNKILYISKDQQGNQLIKLYNKSLDINTTVYRGSIDNTLQNYMQIVNSKIFFFEANKLFIVTPEFNQLPTVYLGENKMAYEGTPVTFSAANSSDSDGKIVSYEWSENGTILSQDVNFTKSDFSVGMHTITLKVTDDKNASSEANVTVTINEFPKEELTSNGEYTNSIDNVFTKRVYTFTVDEKSQVSIDASSDVMKVGAWLIDANDTKISSLEDWQAGGNGQFAYEDILNKGTYSIEFFPQNYGKSGNFSFTFDTKIYSNVIQDPWFVNIAKHKTVALGDTINMCLSVKANDGATLDMDKLNISSDNLPSGLKITKSYLADCDFNLEGKVENTDDFSVTLNITDENITKEHKIDFSVQRFIVDGIIGDGPSGEMAIRKSNLNEYTPFKVAFNLKGDIANIESVACLFGDKLDFGIDDVKYVDYTTYGAEGDSYGKYICDVETATHDNFVGVASGNQLMNRLVALDDSARYMSIVVTFKDGTTLTKKILKKIPIVEIDKPIQLWYVKSTYGDRTFSKLTIWRKGTGNTVIYRSEDAVYAKMTKFNLNYGDEVTLAGGRWILQIGNHQMFMNLSEYGVDGLDFSFAVDENTEKNEAILRLGYVRLGEKLDLYFQKTGHNILAKLTRTLLVAPTYYKPRNSQDEGGFQVTDEDHTAAVRGTTFKISLTDHSANYDLYEGAIDINKSGKITNLKTMQSYQEDTGSVKEITNVSVPSSVKKYFDETSLSLADLNSTTSELDVTTNLDTASYILIGDHVSFGGGKLNSIDNIAEGDYTLQFAPILWNKKPVDRNITFGINNLKETIEANYQKIVDVFMNGVEQEKKVDVNISTANIKVDQLDDESILVVTTIGDKNSSINFNTLNSIVNIDTNGTAITNLPLAKNVKIAIDKSGKVKPTIEDVLLPKEDFPLGTKVKIINNKVRFIVPMNKTLNF